MGRAPGQVDYPRRAPGRDDGGGTFEEREISLTGKARSAGCLALALGGLILAGSGFGPAPSNAADGAIEPALVDPTTPVILVMLDELPTSTLMNAKGQVDAGRYPEIGRFASQSTWYRDHASAGDFTAWAIPPILTGNHANEQTLPTSEVQPDNMFSALGPGRRVHVHEEVTEICPKKFCPDGNQGEFPGQTDAGEFVKQKFGRIDVPDIKRWIKGMPAGGRTLSVLHLLLPHAPHLFLPNGQVYPYGPLVYTIDGFRNGWTVNSAGISLVQQRHMIQAAYADRMVGKVMKKVRQNGEWDRSMVIVTADHGHAFDVRYDRRDANPGSIAAILNPPLMIKYPHQETGQISKKSSQSVDILPTIAEQLGVDLPYSTDGLPISQVPDNRAMYADKDTMRTIDFTTEDIRSQRPALLAQSKRRFGTGGLWKLGPKSKLIGSRPGPRRKMNVARYSIDSPERLAAYRHPGNRPPSLVSGVLTGVQGSQVLAMTMKGKVVATTRSFYYNGAKRFGMMVHPSKLVRSQKKIKLFAIRPSGRLKQIRRG